LVNVLDVASVLVPLAIFSAGMWIISKRASFGGSRRWRRTILAFAIGMAAVLLVIATALDGTAFGIAFVVWLAAFLLGFESLRRTRS
jgi:hypothetical protein